MKKLVYIFIVFLAFAKGYSQILDPVKWTTTIEKKSETIFIITFSGVIEKDWHMYSQFTPDGGPLPLEIIFKNQKGNFNLVGKAKESKTKTAYNDIFEVNETFFEHKAQITQEIELLNPKFKTIEADLNYQVCKEVCINLGKKLTFVIPSLAISTTKVDETTVALDSSRIGFESENVGFI